MANIFLSYVHEDETRARALAAILEREGHEVWWDRQIKGGTQYASEIEAALAASDRIVVLWSTRSVASAWVRDEAAVGRDSGRLIPVAIDGTEPPLGFRQYQTIDLSRWKGRKASPQLKDLIDAVGASPATETTAGASTATRPKLRLSRSVLWTSVVLVSAAAGTAIWLWSSMNMPGSPTIAISPADSSPSSQQLAHDLSIRLGQLPGTDGARIQLTETSGQDPPRGDLVLRAGAHRGGGREGGDLELRSNRGEILWSNSIEQPTSTSADLPQQLAVQAQRALSCASEALAYRRERIQQGTLKLYVSGCTNFDDAYGANLDQTAQIKRFEQVIAKAPHFEAAWAKLLVSEMDGLQSADDPKAVQRKIREQLKQAHDLGLDFGELYAAKAATRSPVDFLGIFRAYDEGIRRYPDNAILYRLRGERSLYVGRMNDSVGDSAHAVQLDPLSPANQQTLASAYVYSGNTEAGYMQLRKAEQMWPGAVTIVNARYRFDLRFGDPKEALLLLQEPGQQGGLVAEQTAFLRARIDPTPANIERVIAEDRKNYEQYPFFISQYVQSLAQFGRKDEVLDILLHYSGGEQSGVNAEVLFRPALRGVWRDPRSMAAAAHLGLLRYWKVSGRWPDFCTDPTLPYNCKKEAEKYRV